jgi:hypothetical protein
VTATTYLCTGWEATTTRMIYGPFTARRIAIQDCYDQVALEMLGRHDMSARHLLESPMIHSRRSAPIVFLHWMLFSRTEKASRQRGTHAICWHIRYVGVDCEGEVKSDGDGSIEQRMGCRGF